MTHIIFGSVPDTDPPTEDDAWIWTGIEWVQVVSDTSDGVPEKLDLASPISESLRKL